MSRQYQDPRYNYQTSYPNPSQQSGQPGQYTQPGQPSSNTYDDRQAYSSYPDGSLQPQSSGLRQGSHSPYAGNVPFPDPQLAGSTGHPQTYISPSQNTPNLTVGTQQHERRASYGHAASTGSFSDSQRSYPAGASSDMGGGSGIYSSQSGLGVQPHHGGGYPATVAQPQDWNAAGYEEGREPRSKGPPNRPTGTTRPLCRYPRCNNYVFFDSRVNEDREWCSDQHMRDAILHRVESPCIICQVWPRRNGSRFCSHYCRSRSQNR